MFYHSPRSQRRAAFGSWNYRLGSGIVPRWQKKNYPDACHHELTPLCRPPLLPPFFLARLSPTERRRMMRNRRTRTRHLDLMRPVRLFFETGVELRFLPRACGLQVQVIYHTHPWLAPATETILHEEHHDWARIFSDPDLSRHARLSEIAQRENLPPPTLADAEVFDSAFEREQGFTHPGGYILVARPDGLGLAWMFSEVATTRISQLNFLIRNTGLGATSPHHAQIVAEAKKARHAWRNLSTWKRIALGTATDIATCTHILRNTVSWTLFALRRLSKKARKTHD